VATDLYIEVGNPQLGHVLEHLRPGERLNLLGPDGKRLAVVISAQPEGEELLSPEEWLARLDARAERISRAWKSDKSAVEILAEMRR